MTRRYDLDWVRVLAFGALVLYHVGMYYVSWDWHVKSPYASESVEPLMMLTSPWRLSLLFLISGVAARFMFDARPGRFLAARSWRLLVPLVFGMLVVVVPQPYFEVVEKLPGGYHDGFLAFYGRYLAGDGSFCRDGDCLDLPTWNHLWFVAYLWVYSVVLWAWRRLAPSTLEGVCSAVTRAMSGAGVLVWPIALLAIARVTLVARFESTHALVDDWYNHAQYLPLFLLGYAVAKNEAAWNRLAQRRGLSLLMAAASYGFLIWYFYGSGYNDDTLPPPDALRQLQRVLWAVNQWTSIVAVLGFAGNWSPSDSPALRYLTQAVFPVYILHQTVIIVLAEAIKPLALSPLVEAPLLVVGTFAGCFLGFEMIRRLAWLRPLFGLSYRLASRPAPASALQAGAQ